MIDTQLVWYDVVCDEIIMWSALDSTYFYYGRVLDGFVLLGEL